MAFMDSVKGFFGKIKSFFGSSGIKMTVALKSTELKKSDSSFGGKITLVAEKDQLITHLTVKMEEDWTTGRGENKTTKTLNMGEKVITENFQIKAGETKTFDFTCDYAVSLSKNQQMQDGGKVSATLGKLGSFMDAEKSEYRVEIWTNIKGILMCPSEKINVTLT